MSNDRNSYFSRKVTLLNAVATVLIVVLHSESPLRFGMPLDGEHYPLIWAVYVMTLMAVPLFFFTSALLFYRQCEWKDIPTKLKKRFFSLVVPFVLWNVLFVALYFVLSRIPWTASRMNLPTSLDTPRDWLLAIWHTRFTPLWFVKYLIIYCLLSPAILLLLKNRWVALTALIALTAYGFLSRCEDYTLVYWLPAYFAGAMAGRYLYAPGQNEHEPLLANLSSKQRGVTGAACLCLFLGLYVIAVFGEEGWRGYRLLSPILVWLMADLLAGKLIRERFRPKRWMAYTFFIYATHYFLINVLQTMVRTLCPATPFVLTVTFLLSPVVVLLLITAIAKPLSRYRLFRIFTGGR